MNLEIKGLVAVVCKDPEDFNLFFDSFVFLAEYFNKGRNVLYYEQVTDNPILNGVMYFHARYPEDFKKKKIEAFYFVDGYEENENAQVLYDAARLRTKVYGKMMKSPLVLPETGRIVEMS